MEAQEKLKRIRHKWKKDQHGKQCEICGSRINTEFGMHTYTETDKWGINEPVNWYPRCNPIKEILNTLPNE